MNFEISEFWTGEEIHLESLVHPVLAMHPTPPSLLFWRWFHVVWPCSSELRSWRRGRNSKRGVLICFARRVRWSPYQWSRRRWNNHYTDSFDEPSVLPAIGIVHKWIKEKNNKFIFFSFLLIPEKYPSFYEIKKSVVRWIHIVQSTPPTQNEWRVSINLSNPLGARPAWRMHTIELYSIQTSFMNADREGASHCGPSGSNTHPTCFSSHTVPSAFFWSRNDDRIVLQDNVWFSFQRHSKCIHIRSQVICFRSNSLVHISLVQS